VMSNDKDLMITKNLFRLLKLNGSLSTLRRIVLEGHAVGEFSNQFDVLGMLNHIVLNNLAAKIVFLK
jgi:hypothetical protein